MTRPQPPSKWTAESRRFIEAGGNTTHAFGLGRMIGRVYAFLYLSPSAVSLEDMAARLKVSKASVSIAVRQLLRFQAVRHEVVPSDRRDYYSAETDFVRIFREGILPGLRKKLRSAAHQIDRTLCAENPPAVSSSVTAELTEPDHGEIRRRLRDAQLFHNRLDRLLSGDILGRFI